MKLSLNLAVFSDRSLEQALDAALAAGISSVELNLDSTDRLTPLTDMMKPDFRAAVARSVASREMEIVAIGNHLDTQLIGGSDKPNSEAESSLGVGRLLDTARVASELGVRTVVGFIGCRNPGAWYPWPDRTAWDSLLPGFAETWLPTLDELATLGVRFAHEPHPLQLAYDLETSLRVTDELERHSQWGFNLDVGNLALSGTDACHFLRELGDRVFHVHAKDFELVEHNAGRSGHLAHGEWQRRDRGYRFRVPGWGQLDWRRLLSELQLSQYAGAVSIEHEDPVVGRDEGVRKSALFLSNLLFQGPSEEPWW